MATAAPKKATIYRMVMPTHTCPYGLKAKDLLQRRGYEVEDHWLRTREETDAFKAEHGVKTTPQTFIGGERVGGYDDLRRFFGKSVADFQNTRFVLAGIKTKLQVGWAHLDWAIRRHLAGELTNEEGAAAKLWHTELQWEVLDACLQLHGGAGYMNEYPIARAWRSARVTRIYGGTNEIMKEVIGRAL